VRISFAVFFHESLPPRKKLKTDFQVASGAWELVEDVGRVGEDVRVHFQLHQARGRGVWEA